MKKDRKSLGTPGSSTRPKVNTNKKGKITSDVGLRRTDSKCVYGKIRFSSRPGKTSLTVSATDIHIFNYNYLSFLTSWGFGVLG